MHSATAPPGSVLPIQTGGMYRGPAAPTAPAFVATVPTPPDLRSVPPEERIAANEYDQFLIQLTFNSKEMINNLTKIAGENIKSATGLSFVIEARIINAAPTGKLPYLYLLDSIVKNIGGVYVHKFSRNLYNVFRNVYGSAAPQVKNSMHRLLNTWPPIFGHDIVTALRRAAVECDTASQQTTIHHGGYAHGLESQRIPRVPLSRPTVQGAPYQATHPTRTRSIVQIPIPKRAPSMGMQQPASQLSGPVGLGMPVGVSAPLSQMPRSVAPSMGMPSMGLQTMGVSSLGMQMGGMNGMYNMQESHPMRHAPQPVVNGVPAAMGNVNSQGLNSVQGIQGVHGVQGMPPMYGMAQQYPMHHEAGAQVMMPGQMNQYRHVSSALAPTGSMYASNGAAMGTAIPAYYAEKMRETERMMEDITRKSAVGIIATSDELATLNSLINTQLGAATPSDRERLLDMRRRVAALSQRVAPVAPPPAAPPAYTAPSPVVPRLNAGALSNLMLSLPKLAASARAVQQHSVQQTPVKGPELIPFSAIRTTSHTAFVRGLYTDLPHLSKSDGMRFATKEKLRTHLDWLFARNRRKRARDRNLATGGLSRCWFDALDVFLGDNPAASAPLSAAANSTAATSSSSTDKAAKPLDPLDRSVEARGDNEKCPACREGFTTFWDDEKQAWMIREAIRNTSGVAFHTRCAASIEDIDALLLDEFGSADPLKWTPSVDHVGVKMDVKAEANAVVGGEAKEELQTTENYKESSDGTSTDLSLAKSEAGSLQMKADNCLAASAGIKRVSGVMENTPVSSQNGNASAIVAPALKRKSCDISDVTAESAGGEGPIKRAKLENVHVVAGK